MGYYDMYINEEMNRLLSWIKSEDVNFYGVDIQYISLTVDFVENFLNEKGYSDTNIDELRSNANLKYEMQVKEKIIDKMENKMNELLKSKSIEEREFDYILHMINCIRKHYEYVLGGNQGSVRDQMMAENVLWVMEHELKYYNNKNIVLFAHNGHIIEDDFKLGNGDILYITMGHNLSNCLGDDYYTIVTAC
ncbi:MAG TPA: erythromycin esterase family protein [Sedimentibacter sp.]|nr:erythromycin esterase family protein [Sedimentibacter sp.]